MVTSVTPLEANLPVRHALAQNYPNPFNPSTTLRFSLASEEHVTLSIVDVNGREVARLAHGTYAAGSYEATWDAGDHAGGVYYCRMLAGGFTTTRPIMLIK